MTAGTEAPAVGLTHSGSEDTGLGHRGPESKSIVVPYGFWLFVLSDMVLFSALFATYASLVHATDGGPATSQLFDRDLVAIETLALLLFELRLRPGDDRRQAEEHAVDAGLAVSDRPLRLRVPGHRTLRVRQDDRRRRRAAAQRLPVVLLHACRLPRRARHRRAAVARNNDGADLGQGLPPHIIRRLLCFSVFWHALDIIWVAIFTIVYLIGTLP